MKEITFSSNFGRFGYSITTEVGTEVNDATAALATEGLANVGFRACGSAIRKALVGKAKDVNGKDVDKKTTTADIAYSAETAELIRAAAQGKLDELAKGSDTSAALPVMVYSATGEHEYGEGGASAMVRATTLVDSFLGTPLETPYRAVLACPEGDRDALIAAAHGMKLGIQPEKKKKEVASAATEEVEE